MIIELVVGDRYDDGHGKTNTAIVEIKNYGKGFPDIWKAYFSGVEKTGINIMDFCEEYEDSTISDEIYSFCKKNNIELTGYNKEVDKQPYVWWKEYVEIWVAIFNYNSCNLRAKLVETESYDIGGYGLYS